MSSTTQIDPVGRIYAEALIELAEQQQQLDAVAEEAADLQSLIDSDADLMRLLSNPIIGRDAKQGIIERAFAGKSSDTLYRFLQVVGRKDRLADLPDILAAVDQMMAERRNELPVTAIVATELDAATADRVAAGIGEATGKNVTLTQDVDPSLLGGIKLRIGDQLIDASVATQLNRIEQQLIAAGREKARELSATA